MHYVNDEELSTVLTCYLEDALERARYKQTYDDAAIIETHVRTWVNYINEHATELASVMKRIRPAHPTDAKL